MADSMGSDMITDGNRRVLLVDDNDINAEIAAIQLRDIGLTVERAADGEQAVNMFKGSDEYYYDIIIMDIMMPVMDGIEATKLIREMDRQDALEIPIIAVSANNYAGDYGQLTQNGVSCFLIKPYSKSKFQTTVREQLKMEPAENVL